MFLSEDEAEPMVHPHARGEDLREESFGVNTDQKLWENTDQKCEVFPPIIRTSFFLLTGNFYPGYSRYDCDEVSGPISR